MTLSKFQQYFLANIPEKKYTIKKIEEAKSDARAKGESAMNKAVVIPQSAQPLWYYFLLFRSLYENASEIALQVQENEYLLLYSIYPIEDYVRPSAVHVFSDLLEKPPRFPAKLNAKMEFDLSKTKFEGVGSFKSLIASLKKDLKFTEEVVLRGETDCSAGLVAFVLWMGYAKEIKYNIENIEITF
ncbi:hypothetical protein KKA13_02560 [Patescibacteria group bacterium]|nr:hypothetical protein [Patescibacteria group bacterium]